MAAKFYITTPIYYVNDQPHLGHAYTTLIADVLARLQRRQLGSKQVWFLTGTDEHGAKVAEKAAAADLPVEEYVERVAGQFRQAWQALNIGYDDFIRTTDERHAQAVTKIMGRLRAAQTPAGREALYLDEYQGLYCIGCEKFLTEKDLVDGLCPLHNRKPELIKEKNWFFRLSDYLPTVEKLISSDELLIQPVERKNEALGFIKQGLTDFSVSRQSVKWGLPIPWDQGQTIYVWVEALMNYVTAIGYLTDDKKFQSWWPAEVQLLGPEILKFHAIYWPALLLALGLSLPRKLLVHSFFTVDGQKMSKSLGNAIDPVKLAERYTADGARYLILSQFAFGAEADIKVSDFDERYTADLANGIGNLVARLTNLAEKSQVSGQIIVPTDDRIARVHHLFLEAQIKEALNLIWEMIRESDQELEKVKPWQLARTDSAAAAELIWRLLSKLKLIGQLIEPVLPETAVKIAGLFKDGRVVKPANLFNRLDDHVSS